MANLLAITEANFDQEVKSSNLPVLIDFWAPWCGPCKSFAPIFEAAAEAHNDVSFVKVNTEEQQELAAHFQIRSIPTLMAFGDQIMIFSQAGMLPEAALSELIGKIKELDMDAVRQEIESQQQ